MTRVEQLIDRKPNIRGLTLPEGRNKPSLFDPKIYIDEIWPILQRDLSQTTGALNHWEKLATLKLLAPERYELIKPSNKDIDSHTQISLFETFTPKNILTAMYARKILAPQLFKKEMETHSDFTKSFLEYDMKQFAILCLVFPEEYIEKYGDDLFLNMIEEAKDNYYAMRRQFLEHGDFYYGTAMLDVASMMRVVSPKTFVDELTMADFQEAEEQRLRLTTDAVQPEGLTNIKSFFDQLKSSAIFHATEIIVTVDETRIILASEKEETSTSPLPEVVKYK